MLLCTMQYRIRRSFVRRVNGPALPSWKRLRAPLGATISAVVITGSLTFLTRRFQVGLNLTNSSCAEGFYRLTDAPIRRGELVAACLPVNLEQQGLERRYLRTGDCAGGAEPVLKVVGGLFGDDVEVEAGWVAINGERVANSATMPRDSAGRPLRHVAWGRHRVGQDEVWLFGFNNLRSWDSRYFGAIPLANVRGVARALLTW
jgi:conjugative transfer signal peptidase TraF